MSGTRAQMGRMMKGRYRVSEVILDALSYDEWVPALEISLKTGIGSHKLAMIISERLLNVDVERRKPPTGEGGKYYEYRRITRCRGL